MTTITRNVTCMTCMTTITRNDHKVARLAHVLILFHILYINSYVYCAVYLAQIAISGLEIFMGLLCIDTSMICYLFIYLFY